ncbi:PfkB family carbohydrate kinase [Glaciihabitans sp. dw_435]|uniref:carbohydrate kinase family protein n=1 Tax=Glaciihabitans sp. dw_435 TaxID=2720081 RepID=UPI001BD68343|nr:PfkB family carbohydrate kinase [Glaciihabitans sp. dw_435]
MPEASARIVIFGDVIDDVVVVPSAAMRPDTDTPSAIRFRAGGSAANTAAWLGHLGADIDFIGRVGADDHARHTALLTDLGTRAHLVADPVLPTGTIVIIVDGQHRSMLTERGANAALYPTAVTDDMLTGARVLHFSGYSLFGDPGGHGIAALITRARALGVEVSIDPGSAGFLADFGPRAFLDAIRGTSIIFPNLEEGRQLTGQHDPWLITTQLARTFPVVVLTLGDGGVIVARGGQHPTRVAAVDLEVVDPTGAGDAFAAGFLANWVVTGDPMLAAAAGSQVAAKAVTEMGGRPLR